MGGKTVDTDDILDMVENILATTGFDTATLNIEVNESQIKRLNENNINVVQLKGKTRFEKVR